MVRVNALGTFGAAVRDRRKKLGLSQDALAAKTGLHRTYIGGVERGERNISLLNICVIADALSISISDLLADVGAHAPKRGVAR